MLVVVDEPKKGERPGCHVIGRLFHINSKDMAGISIKATNREVRCFSATRVRRMLSAAFSYGTVGGLARR